jgi:hypothetical protein
MSESETTSTTAARAAEVPIEQTVARVRSAASWFFWIAALSIANTVLVQMKSQSVTALGLGVTLVIDTIGGTSALVISVLCAGFFALLGWQARQFKLWPFYVGLAVYALDASIFVFARDWIGIAIHAFVLFVLFAGASSLRTLRKAGPAAAAAAA